MKCCKEESGECLGTEESSCCGGGCSDCSSTETTRQNEMMCCDNEEDFRYSNALDAGKLVILSMVTMSAYHIYWMYRNWKHIKEYTKKPLRPAGRTVATLFPVLDVALFCVLFTDIHSMTKKEGRRSFPLPWVCVGYGALLIIGWVLLGISILFTSVDPILALAIFFLQMFTVLLATLTLIPVQMTLNDFWKHEQPNQPLQISYTNGEIAWIVVGGLFFLVSLVSFFLPPPLPPYDYLPLGTDDGISYSVPGK
ncbi:MAG: hypothetical protein Q8P56_05215 [Candidatus Uhrbacteria bacterium]|nr:hypothetical protein [Candidatus Uhrbacteria bacterium]